MPVDQLQHAHHAVPVLSAVTGKLAALNWSDFIKTVAPALLGMILISGAVVKVYGDMRSSEIIRIVDDRTKALEKLIESEISAMNELVETRIEVATLRMQAYADKKREGRFTTQDFEDRMVLRDAEVQAIAQKQDEVRERLIANLRTDLERLESQFSEYAKTH